jgi:putative transposase
MDNHLHLLLTAEAATGCAVLMKAIAQLYAQYINKNYRRSGYLWESRFKSCLVQSEGYLLACYRYIELNPVRAGLVRRPDEYRWSSYVANARGEPSSLITPHDQYVALGRDLAERQAVYRELFGSRLSAVQVTEIRNATNGGYVLGSHAFKKVVSHALGRRVEKGIAGRPTRADDSRDQLDLL